MVLSEIIPGLIDIISKYESIYFKSLREYL